jgi:hypothetical protein
LSVLSNSDKNSPLGKLLVNNPNIITFGPSNLYHKLNIKAVYVSVPPSAYHSFLKEVTSETITAAFSRGTEAEWVQYVEAVLSRNATIAKVVAPELNKAGAAKAVCMQAAGEKVTVISTAGSDTCADVTLITLTVCHDLGANVIPSTTTINQSGGKSARVLGKPDKPICVILGKGTPQEFRVHVKRVYVVESIGAGVHALVGTEVFVKSGSVLDFTYPARWMWHPRYLSDGDLSVRGELPLSVLDVGAKPVAGLVAAMGEAEVVNVLVTEAEGEIESEVAGADESQGGTTGQVQGEGVQQSVATTKGQHTVSADWDRWDEYLPGWSEGEPDAGGLVLCPSDVLPQAYLEGDLYPKFVQGETPPPWEEVMPAICSLLKELEDRGMPLQPPEDWRLERLPVNGLDYVCWLGGQPPFYLSAHHQYHHGPTAPWSVSSGHIKRGRWQLVCRAIADPTGEHPSLLHLTQEQYESNKSRAWVYVAQQLHKEAFRRYRDKHIDEPELWDLRHLIHQGGELHGIEAVLQAYFSQAVPTQLDQIEGWIRTRINLEHMEGPPDLEQLAPDLQAPLEQLDFSAPLEEAWYRRLRQDEGYGSGADQEQRKKRWVWAALYTAIYGYPAPRQEITARQWEAMTHPTARAAYLNKKILNAIYYKWALDLEKKTKTGGLGPAAAVKWKLQLPEGRPTPTPAWAEEYIASGAAGDLMPPSAWLWASRDRGLARVANHQNEWQLDYSRIKEAANNANSHHTLPLAVEVTAEIHEARRWSWAKQNKSMSEMLYDGLWHVCSEEEQRAAYLKQLYRTANRLIQEAAHRSAHLSPLIQLTPYSEANPSTAALNPFTHSPSLAANSPIFYDPSTSAPDLDITPSTHTFTQSSTAAGTTSPLPPRSLEQQLDHEAAQTTSQEGASPSSSTATTATVDTRLFTMGLLQMTHMWLQQRSPGAVPRPTRPPTPPAP